ncbi:hypothetical protein FISHEDRAFT_34441 [Fistulina hepatica ATCC 64428]|uniref:Large ribosomal subunit protein mL44 n=1 Tax=Fistulina hepatica ATCC 64428 TaxID=1128425 RepID=A0A0D7AMA4_9AGAR|nr:hypothetical protein FISHEDRAFT_34441 [Fistulina hepatica ATCC 64428]
MAAVRRSAAALQKRSLATQAQARPPATLNSVSAAKMPSVSIAEIADFPPKSAVFLAKKIPGAGFDAELWAAAQPPPSTALVAFAHRIGLASVLLPELGTDTDLVLQTLTHRSFLPLYLRLYPPGQRVSKETGSLKHNSLPLTNAQLEQIGNSLLGMFATEYLMATYPYLPTRVLKAAVTAYVGPQSCASIAKEIGASNLVRWWREARRSDSDIMPTHVDALASVPRSLCAVVYRKRGILAARQFCHSFFLKGRELDGGIRKLIKFANPKRALLSLVKRFDRERPKSRLLKETGRFSNSPVFVVGIFSGPDQLGEGFGTSLKMAEYRAAEDALLRVYLTQRLPSEIQLPSSTFPVGTEDVFRLQGPEGEYHAPELGVAEILYASSGKDGVPQVVKRP